MSRHTLVAVVLLLGAAVATAQPDPDSPTYKAVVRLEEFLSGDMPAATFVAEHFATEGDIAALAEQLEAVRERARGGELDGVMRAGPESVRMEWFTAGDVLLQIGFELDRDDPAKFRKVELVSVEEPEETPSWEELSEWLHAEGEEGFTGAVLVVRDGEEFLAWASGWADAEKQIPNTPETIFAIGSTPIDFTMASIFQLAERGQLSLDDTLPTFFEDVPEDKRSMTVNHLLSGASGLPDFHDLPKDENPDHTWIDREEAMRRIFAQELLFPPGEGRQHSHSAFGVLAAIVEIVSGQSYQEYTRQNLFEPAGMVDTGFFGTPIPEERLAVGRGFRSSGEINAPPYWGKTSWLVMGSGGQTSTVRDLNRWLDALWSGKILEDPSHLRRIVGPGGSAQGQGGNMFGFQIFYSMGQANRAILISNAVANQDDRQRNRGMMRALAPLVQPPGSPYSLGIAIDTSHGVLQRVMPGSAAERDGLRAGDRVLSIAGTPVAGRDPLEILDPLLQDGASIEFVIERGGERVTLRVTPNRRES